MFICGWATRENLCHIPIFLVKSLKELQSNYFPLSEMSILGIPNQQIMLPHTKSNTFRAVIVGIASASGHLEKDSITTITKFFYPTVLRNGPSISIFHCDNGQGLDILYCGVPGMLITLVNLWQTSLFFMKSPASFFTIGQ